MQYNGAIKGKEVTKNEKDEPHHLPDRLSGCGCPVREKNISEEEEDEQ